MSDLTPVNGITDAMIETAAATITQEWSDELSTHEMARIVLESALAGRVVVDLPVHVVAGDNLIAVASPAEDDDVTAEVDADGEPLITDGIRTFDAEGAELHGLALVAAARAGRAMAAEVSGGVGGDTR